MKKKLGLPNITLLAASSVKVDLVQDALKISSYEIGFASIKLLSSSKPKIKFSEIEYVPIPEMDLDGYCKFLVEDLYKYFDTSHCLLIQEDSFVANPNEWNDDFTNCNENNEGKEDNKIYDIGEPYLDFGWKSSFFHKKDFFQ